MDTTGILEALNDGGGEDELRRLLSAASKAKTPADALARRLNSAALDGWSVVQLAAHLGNAAVLRLLVALPGVLVHEPHPATGSTPLVLALLQRAEEAVGVLCDCGKDLGIATRNKKGQCAAALVATCTAAVKAKFSRLSCAGSGAGAGAGAGASATAAPVVPAALVASTHRPKAGVAAATATAAAADTMSDAEMLLVLRARLLATPRTLVPVAQLLQAVGRTELPASLWQCDDRITRTDDGRFCVYTPRHAVRDMASLLAHVHAAAPRGVIVDDIADGYPDAKRDAARFVQAAVCIGMYYGASRALVLYSRGISVLCALTRAPITVKRAGDGRWQMRCKGNMRNELARGEAVMTGGQVLRVSCGDRPLPPLLQAMAAAAPAAVSWRVAESWTSVDKSLSDTFQEGVVPLADTPLPRADTVTPAPPRTATARGGAHVHASGPSPTAWRFGASQALRQVWHDVARSPQWPTTAEGVAEAIAAAGGKPAQWKYSDDVLLFKRQQEAALAAAPPPRQRRRRDTSS